MAMHAGAGSGTGIDYTNDHKKYRMGEWVKCVTRTRTRV